MSASLEADLCQPPWCACGDVVVCDAGVFFCVRVYAVTSVFACAVACRRGKSQLFYTLTMFHRISVKKVTKSFQLDVTNGEKSSIILKCTILYKISEISNWRQINQSKMR